MVVGLLKALETHVLAVKTSKSSEVLAVLHVVDCIPLVELLSAVTVDVRVAVRVGQMLNSSLPIGVSLFANVADVGI